MSHIHWVARQNKLENVFRNTKGIHCFTNGGVPNCLGFSPSLPPSLPPFSPFSKLSRSSTLSKREEDKDWWNFNISGYEQSNKEVRGVQVGDWLFRVHDICTPHNPMFTAQRAIQSDWNTLSAWWGSGRLQQQPERPRRIRKPVRQRQKFSSRRVSTFRVVWQYFISSSRHQLTSVTSFNSHALHLQN